MNAGRAINEGTDIELDDQMREDEIFEGLKLARRIVRDYMATYRIDGIEKPRSEYDR